MDYAAAPIQPVVQGLVSISPTVSFYGSGVQSIAHPSTGVYVLTLDPGLIGNAGEVQALPNGATKPAAPDPRSLIMIRGDSQPTILQALVGYGQSSTPPADGGLNQITVTMRATTPVDVPFEIIVWVGVGSAQL